MQHERQRHKDGGQRYYPQSGNATPKKLGDGWSHVQTADLAESDGTKNAEAVQDEHVRRIAAC
ncbi:MAG: hypothetical protein CMJ64_14455 [Planctomycetaceae bacterium]|nr:hypothetical protein [Planctomycetaceae bacterium]